MADGEPRQRRGNGADGQPLHDLQRLQARLAAGTGQIVIRAMGEIARRQATALEELLGELEGADGANGQPWAAALGEHCLRASLNGFVIQLRLGLESATAIQGAAFDLLRQQLDAGGPGRLESDRGEPLD